MYGLSSVLRCSTCFPGNVERIFSLCSILWSGRHNHMFTSLEMRVCLELNSGVLTKSRFHWNFKQLFTVSYWLLKLLMHSFAFICACWFEQHAELWHNWHYNCHSWLERKGILRKLHNMTVLYVFTQTIGVTETVTENNCKLKLNTTELNFRKLYRKRNWEEIWHWNWN